MIILGVDPGSRITGYGIIKKTGDKLKYVSCGVIKSTPSRSFPERIKELHGGLSEVITKFGPQCAAVEDVFLARNAQSALKLGQARGALIVAIMEAGLDVREFSAKQVKQTVTGYGQAGKAQIQNVVRIMLKLRSSPSEDAADALANAICLANHMDY